MSFITKDSGEREEFSTGSVRDDASNKPRYDLIPVGPLTRVANLYMRGAVKYSVDNWTKGQPYRRVYASMLRHIFAWFMGENEEDHLSAIAWNAFALMYYEEEIAKGELPQELDDRPQAIKDRRAATKANKGYFEDFLK